MVNLLNSCGQIPLESEVVIAVPSIHLLSTKDMIRNDIAIASEVRYRVFAPEIPVHSINISVLKTSLHYIERTSLSTLATELTLAKPQLLSLLTLVSSGHSPDTLSAVWVSVDQENLRLSWGRRPNWPSPPGNLPSLTVLVSASFKPLQRF